MLFGGTIVFLTGLILYIITSTGDHSFPFFNKGVAVSLISCSVFFVLFGFLFTKNDKSVNAKQVFFPLAACLILSVILFFIIGYTALFRILLFSIWFIGGVLVLAGILLNTKKRKNS